MRIVIVGAGAVGFHLVRELAAEGHSVALIEGDAQKLEHVRDRVDVLTVLGSGTARESLESAGAAAAELFIAVTDLDELNLVSCAAAHELGAQSTLARVRNPDLSADPPLVDPLKFGVTRTINPDEIAVDSIVALVDAPGTVDAGDFADGRILLRSFDVTANSPFVRRPPDRLREDHSGAELLLVAIQREGQGVPLARGELLREGDRAYAILTPEALPLFRKLVAEGESAQRIVVHGAGRFGVAICQRLQERATVVLIDDDRRLCEAAAAKLNNTVVLCGSPNDSDIQGQSRLSSADLFIGAGANEEHTLILALLAKKRGVRRNMLVTADPDLTLLLDSLDIDAVINPRLTMVGHILRFARRGRVRTVQKLSNSQAEVVELVVRKGARAEGATLAELALPAGVRVGAVLRGVEAFVVHGGTRLLEGDVVVAFVAQGLRALIERTFARGESVRFGSARGTDAAAGGASAALGSKPDRT